MIRGSHLGEATRWALRQRALSAEAKRLNERIAVVREYRDSLIRKRDHKASQIPLRPAEERMWEHKIDLAEQTITTLRTELSIITGPSRVQEESTS